MTKDGDIDRLIVGPPPASGHEASVQVRDAFGDSQLAVDMILITTERFEATRNRIGGIAYPAHKYGSVLYDAA